MPITIAAFTMFTMLVLASLGLFLSGVAAWRQAKLSKRMFNLRFRSESEETSIDSDSN